MDDVILNKSESIKRCILRIEQDYDEEFENNYTKQESFILHKRKHLWFITPEKRWFAKKRKNETKSDD